MTVISITRSHVDNIAPLRRGRVNIEKMKLNIRHPLDTEERPVITKEDWAATFALRDLEMKKAG